MIAQYARCNGPMALLPSEAAILVPLYNLRRGIDWVPRENIPTNDSEPAPAQKRRRNASNGEKK